MRFAVGYQTINLVEGGNLLGVNFEKVGDSETMGLADILITKGKLTSVNASLTSFTGDYIDMWDSSTGDWGATYHYCDISAYGEGYTDAWLSGITKVNPVVHPGDAFWLFCKKPVEGITFNGQVGTEASGTIVLVEGGNLLANTKPTALNLSDKSQVVITGQTSVNASLTSFSGDYIDLWDLETGDWGKTYHYCNISSYGESYTDVWLSGISAVDTAIPSGSGFWYFAKQPGVTITFK